MTQKLNVKYENFLYFIENIMGIKLLHYQKVMLKFLFYKDKYFYRVV